MEFKCQVDSGDFLDVNESFDKDNELAFWIMDGEDNVKHHVLLDVDQVKQLKNYLELVLENNKK